MSAADVNPASSATNRRPVAWSIAGSDSGGGAGIQADLRAFDAFDIFGCTALAAVTAQNSVAVTALEAVPAPMLDRQLAALASDLPPRAIKLGLLGSVDNLRCVARWVDRLRQAAPLALVVDPVWRASSGRDLANRPLRQAMVGELLPRASLITPNRAEAAWLLGIDPAELASAEAVEQAARELRSLGADAVVITGGDVESSLAADRIDTAQACGWLTLPRIATRDHHGSGCVHAASAAAAMALGFCAADALVLAKMSVTHGLVHAVAAGGGPGVVRPRAGFGRIGSLLPMLTPGWPQPAGQTARCAALANPDLGLYAVVDSADRVQRVLDAGVRSVQLRIKDRASAGLSGEVARSVASARRHGAQLFINDHWRLAIEHGAYGVHLGQEDLEAADFDALRRAGLRVGLSSHSPWEVCRALALAPSYVACGPLHPTVTKDMPWLSQGLHNLAYWCATLDFPVVTIGGIDVPRAGEAARCGAAGIAVLRGIAQAGDLAAHVDALHRAIAAGRAMPALAAPALPNSTLAIDGYRCQVAVRSERSLLAEPGC